MRMSCTALVGLVVALASMATAQTAVLAGSEWRFLELGGHSLPHGTQLVVQFRGEGKFSGHGGCNRFFGTYKVFGTNITIGQVGVTRMSCPKPVMELETGLLSALTAARSFQRNRTELVLFDVNGHTIARLRQTDWD